MIASNTELTAVAALDKLHHGSLEEAERQHALAVRRSEPIPAERREHLELTLTLLRLSLARQRGDLNAATGEAGRGGEIETGRRIGHQVAAAMGEYVVDEEMSLWDVENPRAVPSPR